MELVERFFHWVGSIWVEQNAVPIAPAALARFDIGSLIPEYHRFVEAGGRVDVDHGLSMEQAFLMRQLVEHRPLVCVINTLQSPQQATRISRALGMDGPELIDLLRRMYSAPVAAANLFGSYDRMLDAGVYDGDRVAHVITLMSIDRATGQFVYNDPWPGRSLLCAENNSAGVAAQPHPSRERFWVLSAQEMESVLHYAIVSDDDLTAAGQPAPAPNPGADPAVLERSEFFRWFHLEKIGSRDEEGLHSVTYRPSGGLFRDAVTLVMVTRPGMGLEAAMLRLHRGFIDSPHDGVFAADIAKSFLNFMAGDDIGVASLAHDIERLNSASKNPGYQVYRGISQSYELAVGNGILALVNQVATGKPYFQAMFS